MSESEDASEFGITEEDREKLEFLSASENGASIANHRTLEKAMGWTESENDNQPESSGKRDFDTGRSEETRKMETRERVLTPPEFERLLIGALRIDDSTQALETWCAMVILGRLGLRGGEFCHFDAEWYDSRNQFLSIPAHDPCNKGQNGGPCGDCLQAARQRQDHGDERDVEEIAADYWQPKTDAAVRDIPVGWSARVEEAVLILLQLHGGWPTSFSTLQRRLDDAIKNAPMLEPPATSLHGLRGSAATYHAGNGVEREALKQMLGWRDEETPKKYLRVNGNMTKRALSKVYR